MKRLHKILGSIIMIMSLIFLSVALNMPMLMVFSIILGPAIIILLTKKFNIEIKRYYGALAIVFVASFIVCGVFVPKKTVATNVDNVTSKAEDKVNTGEVANDTPKEETKKEAEKSEEKINSVKEATIHFINTGNSDSILIVQGDKSILIDGGDNDDESLVPEYIKKQGVTNLTYMIATHPHADHIGGLDGVLKTVKVEKLLVANGSSDTKTYTDFINAAANKGVSPSVPVEGAEFKLSDSSYIKIFNTNGGKDENEQSLVTLFINGNDKALFMGDADTGTESEILNNLTDVNLLKVGHHGSRTATSDAFLSKVKPEYAVITVGADNKYHHPHGAVMSRLKALGIKVHRTDECGTVVFKSTGSGMSTDCKDGSYNFRDDGRAASDSSNESNKSSQPKEQAPASTPEPQQSQSDSGQTVYWTPKGKSYHRSKGCGTLKNRTTIYSGTIDQSGKSDPCDKCN